MTALLNSDREWFYLDTIGGAQKGPIPATVLSKLLEKGIVKSSEKKSFIGDNGVKYGWDDETQDWVEMEGEDDDDDEDMVFSDEEDEENPKKRSSKKKKRKLPNTWIYVTGLPKDVTAEEIKDHFSKVGLIALSPYDQQPYIKMYKNDDCSLCYNAEESATTAVDFLDGGYIRPTHKVTVKKADFTSGGAAAEGSSSSSSGNNISSAHGGKKAALSHAQIKVAKHAIQQALTWNEDDDIGVSRAAALRIVVLEGMFSTSDFAGPEGESFGEELEGDVAGECEKCGEIEKITLFSKNPR
eukprot:gene21568-27606_t